MFAAILYASETWWLNDKIQQMLLTIERKIIKRILGVKQGPTNNVIYLEINEADIVSKKKDRQKKFYQKATFDN